MLIFERGEFPRTLFCFDITIEIRPFRFSWELVLFGSSLYFVYPTPKYYGGY